MGINVLSVRHDSHGLAEIERVSAGATALTDQLAELPEVAGSIVLNTCNRFELIWDGPVNTVMPVRALADQSMSPPPSWQLHVDEDAVRHVFSVAAGLASMVVGEREIAGQLKTAAIRAHEAGRLSADLQRLVEQSLTASRKVANQTTLAAQGRSLVNIGLDLLCIADWSAHSVAIVGTGSYAGAVVAALRARGVNEITSHSVGSRENAFAVSHQLQVADELSQALASDVVITCRGRGPIVSVATLADLPTPPIFLDLALPGDVEESVGYLTRVVRLRDIEANVDAPTLEQVALAEQIVADAVQEFLQQRRARAIGPAVAELRAAVMSVVDDEIARLPQRQLTHDDAAQALRRLAARLLHEPSQRAHEAAQQGRAAEFVQAMSEVYGGHFAVAELMIGNDEAQDGSSDDQPSADQEAN